MSMVTVITAVTLATAACSGSSTTGDDGGDATGTPTQNGAISTGAARPDTELVRITGEIEHGTQPGCMVLDADFTKYVLLGGDPAGLEAFAEDDTEVTVTGQAHTPTPTECTDGIPLAIQEIVPAT
ncbi:hypothetical protein [Actinophytocola glycyrrhizae]|uniref:Lipoprotein antigen n=1 Tax=Actinophytocola glycyrrhizae TaxID=2044873 RepID=A0ABV9S7P7_9PSEU